MEELIPIETNLIIKSEIKKISSLEIFQADERILKEEGAQNTKIEQQNNS